MSKTLLITGGTGFLGRHLALSLGNDPRYKKIILFSRRWSDQQKVRNVLGTDKYRYITGDVRDPIAVRNACRSGVDEIIHTAAYKSVPDAEYNPLECISVNIDGSKNVMQAAVESGINKVVFISTDKAVSPCNLYGQTKAAMERMVIAGNNLSFVTRMAVCRYGNVWRSTGSFPDILYKKFSEEKRPSIAITNGQMTRFFIGVQQSSNFVLSSLFHMHGGETFVPVMRSAEISDVVYAFHKAFNKNAYIHRNRARPGEKSHEDLISKHETHRTRFVKDRYIIYPEHHDWDSKMIPSGDTVDREINSYTADRLTKEQLEQLIRTNVPFEL